MNSLLNKLIAHRGAKFHGLENTKEAFNHSIKTKYYGIECDIQPTKDNRLVVFHDLDLNRLAKMNQTLADLRWDDLKEIELTKVEVDKNTYMGHIMLVEDFLSMIKDSSSKAFIELKETIVMDHFNELMSMINRLGVELSQIVIIANRNNFDLLKEIRRSHDKIKLQFVACTGYQDFIDDCIASRIDLDICSKAYFENKSQFHDYVTRFHEHNLEVNVWVVDDVSVLKELEAIGVDYITTDVLTPTV